MIFKRGDKIRCIAPYSIKWKFNGIYTFQEYLSNNPDYVIVQEQSGVTDKSRWASVEPQGLAKFVKLQEDLSNV